MNLIVLKLLNNLKKFFFVMLISSLGFAFLIIQFNFAGAFLSDNTSVIFSFEIIKGFYIFFYKAFIYIIIGALIAFILNVSIELYHSKTKKNLINEKDYKKFNKITVIFGSIVTVAITYYIKHYVIESQFLLVQYITSLTPFLLYCYYEKIKR